MLNTYLIKLYFYTGKPFSVEVQAESSVKALATLLEVLPKKQQERNIDTAKIHRIL